MLEYLSSSSGSKNFVGGWFFSSVLRSRISSRYPYRSPEVDLRPTARTYVVDLFDDRVQVLPEHPVDVEIRGNYSDGEILLQCDPEGSLLRQSLDARPDDVVEIVVQLGQSLFHAIEDVPSHVFAEH